MQVFPQGISSLKIVFVFGLSSAVWVFTSEKQYHNPNTIKSYKILQKLSPKHAARGVVQSPYLSIGTERLAYVNNPHGVQLETLA